MTSWVRDRRLNPDDPIDAQTVKAGLVRSHLPERYWVCKPELVRGDNTWIIDATKDPSQWANNGCGFYIHGEFDCGKSGAAACLLIEMVMRGHACDWVSVRDIPGIVFKEDDEKRVRFNRLKDLDLLVIDDIGSQRFKLSGPAGTALEDVIRIMFDKGRPVVYTSNVGWDQFAVNFSAVPALVSVVQRTTWPVLLLDSWNSGPHGS